MCGMTRTEDVAYAIKLGVNAIGLIFYPKSTRAVSLEEAKLLTETLPPFVDVVAVVVNPDKDRVQQIVDELPVQLLQFHGEESAEFCQQFALPYIKAVPANNSDYLIQAAKEYSSAAALLLDTPSTTNKGGSGLSFNWDIIPNTLTIPIILAGGINESNVQAAIKSCNPYAVDLCSGIESQPGIKDHQKMRQFINELWGNNE